MLNFDLYLMMTLTMKTERQILLNEYGSGYSAEITF